MDKAHAQRTDPYLSLLEYRNTPVDGLKSPAQLLMSRRLRSILPTTDKQLEPEVVCRSTVCSRREICQERQKLYYDKTARTRPALPAGATIRFQLPSGKWEPATVIDSAGTPRSYSILTDEGHVLRRNKRHLIRSESSTDREAPTRDPDPENAEPMTMQQGTEGLSGLKEPLNITTTRSGRTVKPRDRLDLLKKIK